MRICVYAASSPQAAPEFKQAARRLGEVLAENRCSFVYGGGSQGLMGELADGALSRGGEVIGILPKFMADLEWGHPGLTHLDLVEDMRERKHKLSARPLLQSDHPAQHARFCDGLQAFMGQVIEEKFLNPEHAQVWSLVDAPADILPAIRATPAWRSDARDYAIVR